MNSVCGFFGLHPWELPWDTESDQPNDTQFRQQLEAHLASLVMHQNATRFLVVMNGGASLLAAEEVLAMKTLHPVTLECIIPFEEIHVGWSETERNRFFSILERCDMEQMMNCGFSLNCYRRCARYLVDQCATLLILWNGKPGDAGDTVTLARRSGRNTILLSPFRSDDSPE